MNRDDFYDDFNQEYTPENVASVKDLRNLIDQHKTGDGVDLLVKRMNAGLMVIRLA